MDKKQYVQAIESGRTFLGIELGSTRIKAVLIDEAHTPIAYGSHDWQNTLDHGIWTYPLEDVWKGLQDCFSKLAEDVNNTYGVPLRKLGAIGFSAMMHGYLAFDKQNQQLVPFRTWRNTKQEEAAEELTRIFDFNIPQRWSIAHLYQAILNNEDHINDVHYITTLAGYVHWKLTGEKVLGVGDASGMFPIDSETNNYNTRMLQQFNEIISARSIPWKLEDILPVVKVAGEEAGVLSAEGAKLLDPSGMLEAGVPLCPPEGDAGTGMTATNSVAMRTGNVSAGTSIFAMIVLEKNLSKVYTEIDMVTTPVGKPVAMVHCNTCTSDVDAWVNIFAEFSHSLGVEIDKTSLYSLLYQKALIGDSDCGGLINYNYYSGEPVTKLEEGRPLFVRKPDSKFNLANFMRAQLFSTMATLKLGMDILFEEEQVKVDQLLGHGGLFKTKEVGQKLMAGALGVPVAVMETAGEGGPWGMALLAEYMINKEVGETLEDYLTGKVFVDSKSNSISPDVEDTKGFLSFMEGYKKGLAIEQAAVKVLK
ncbi:MAG: FGGY-family carbohydrate kinase [Clostridiales bacterium]|nr:FGGY-family carbohydrate kinase [Clostridiales bacterium]